MNEALEQELSELAQIIADKNKTIIDLHNSIAKLRKRIAELESSRSIGELQETVRKYREQELNS